MPILLRNIPLGLDQPEDELVSAIARRLRIPVRAIRTYAIVRRAVDARKKDVHFSYHVEVALDEPPRAEEARLRRLRANEAAWILPQNEPEIVPGSHPLPERPIIIGLGPGGMFAALRLAQLGYRPAVLERGRDVLRRHRDVMRRYYRERDFDPESNLLFGEGGAGAYSDGKLYTRIRDPRCRFVLETLYQHGADPDILLNSRPHLGSDKLPGICRRLRRRLEGLGGEVRFECQADDIRLAVERKSEVIPRLAAIHVTGPGLPPGGEWMPCGPTILAIGHSARDTIRMLHRHGVALESKPFQLGVRLEHPQSMVDRWQYGAAAGHRRLGPAEYQMVARGSAGRHGDLFSFCMCPGGMIVPAHESPALIATNGASRARRAGPFANSGFVITLAPDQTGHDALAGLEFQQRWEHLAFEATGRSYRVPAQRASDYLSRRRSEGVLETSFPLGGQWTDVRDLIPEQVAAALDTALPRLGARFPGFAGDETLITAPETRASSPVRIARDLVSREAIRTANLYPVGEGAGYAGGIVSAAVDGLKTADAIIRRYAPMRV